MPPFKIACLLLIPFLAQAQDTEDKIRQVENGLVAWVTFDNAPPIRGNILQRMKDHTAQGVSIAVIRDYKIDWARGYGFADVEEKRPVTPQTLFQAASISKSINGVAILKLVEQGKLKLDEDIRQYLKTWRPSADSGKITLAHLLSHTAGLTIHGFPGYKVTDTLPTVEQILSGQRPANTKEVKPAFAPGKKMQYSGGGTTVTQLILTGATGAQYDQFLQQEVLDPMGMKGSFFTQPAPAHKTQLLATAYHESGQPVKGKYHVYPEMAAAGLWTSPTDLARYVIETQLSYEGKSSKVLSPAMTKTRLTPFMNAESALGAFIVRKKYFSHNGGNEGFSCVYIGSLEGGNGFVIMTNGNVSGLIQEISRSIASAYGWTDLILPPTVKKLAQQPAADSLQRFTGKYSAGNDVLAITAQSGHLYLSVNGSNPMQLYFTGPAEFVLTEVPGDLRFNKTAAGYDVMVKQGGWEQRFAAVK